MGNSTGVSPREEGPQQCLHNRLLERVEDRKGERLAMMKCCECGALVQRPSHDTPRS
jgi:hypothetical protein